MSGEDTDLEHAFLNSTNLTNAQLANTNLRNANLSRAILDGADIRGTCLIGAIVDNPTMGHGGPNAATINNKPVTKDML